MAEAKNKNENVTEVAEDVTEAGKDIVAADEATVQSAGTTDVVSIIKSLNDGDTAFYSTIKGGTFQERKQIAAALTTSEPIDDHLGKTINLVNFIVQPVDLVDDKGEVNTAPRAVLIDLDGSAYHATSVGILSSLRNILAAMGEPESWGGEALAIKVEKQMGRNGFKFMTIRFV